MINQFGVMPGFYTILPNLSAYLSGDLGLSAATVGLVLGVRTLSQQGLTLFGGTAAGGNFLIGYLADLGRAQDMAWLPWSFLVAVGLAAAWWVTRMRHIPEGDEKPPPAVAVAGQRPQPVEGNTA